MFLRWVNASSLLMATDYFKSIGGFEKDFGVGLGSIYGGLVVDWICYSIFFNLFLRYD